MPYHARTHPDHRLTRWWPESRCAQTGAFAQPGDPVDLHALTPPIRPDGHGIWTTPNTHVPFFLEHDTGTEPLTELLRKLIGYTQLATAGGPRWPVLFWLHSTTRAHHLHQHLATLALTIPVATASRDHATHTGHNPAGPIRRLHAHPGPLTLADLATAIPDPQRKSRADRARARPPRRLDHHPEMSVDGSGQNLKRGDKHDHRASGGRPSARSERKAYRCHSLTANDPDASPQYPTTSPTPCSGAWPSTSSPATNPDQTATAATSSAPGRSASAPRHPTPAERSHSPGQPHAPSALPVSRYSAKQHQGQPRHATETSSAGSRHRSQQRPSSCPILGHDGN
ncbi:replication-relaxation family protein [Micromonospora sp. CPCC 205556]|uniref:replication-relaxation family protein n=1 Tax=Micromonospora sp. CPCC 205556 TaxID=3122398 RepID=UPI003FA5E9A3